MSGQNGTVWFCRHKGRYTDSDDSEKFPAKVYLMMSDAVTKGNILPLKRLNGTNRNSEMKILASSND
jgi:hypothetical protein